MFYLPLLCPLSFGNRTETRCQCKKTWPRQMPLREVQLLHLSRLPPARSLTHCRPSFPCRTASSRAPSRQKVPPHLPTFLQIHIYTSFNLSSFLLACVAVVSAPTREQVELAGGYHPTIMMRRNWLESSSQLPFVHQTTSILELTASLSQTRIALTS